MAASEDALGALHQKVAETLTEMLDGQVIGETEDEETGEKKPIIVPPSAAVLTASIQFLKNNSITCTPTKDNAVGALAEKAAERARKREERKATSAEKALAAQDMAFLGGLEKGLRPN